MRSAAWIPLLMVAALSAGVAGGPCLAAAQTASPCGSLSRDPRVRRAEASEAFAKALEAIRHTYYASRSISTIPAADLARICQMEVVDTGVIWPLEIVRFLVPSDPAWFQGWLGLSGGRVTLLNVIRSGDLTRRLDLRSWNNFVRSDPRLHPLVEPGAVLTYACFVYSLASEYYPPNICDWNTTIRLEKVDSTSYRILFPEVKRSVWVSKDRQVLELNPF